MGISADMGGNVSKEMERFYEGSVAMWSSGAAGDINPVMSNQVYREEFRTGKPVEIYEKNGVIPISMLHTLVAHLFADVKNTVRKIKDYSDKCEFSSEIRWAKTPGLDENGEYKVFVHKLQIGEIILMGFGGELYSALGKEIQEKIGKKNLILINHDASLLYNSGYIYSDEVFELAEKYESNIVGMNHTWMKPGYILEALVKNMQEMFYVKFYFKSKEYLKKMNGGDIMSYEKLPELFPEEKAMPLAKYYYNYPMRDLPEDLKKQIFGPPMNMEDAVNQRSLLTG